MEVVFTLLAERYEWGSADDQQPGYSKWKATFKDAMMTAAAVDRLVHHNVIIDLNILSSSKEGLLSGRSISVHTTTLEADAALKSIVRRDNRQSTTTI